MSKMKFHVRKIDQKMNESKYNTISFDKNKGVTFNDMYHCYYDLLQNIAADMALQIKVGQYGAQSTSIENARHGYYLCKFLETPYMCQESGRLLCKIQWWEEIKSGNVPWFFPVSYEEVIEMDNLVMVNLVLKKVSTHNIPHQNIKKECAERKACKVSDGCHRYIIDEIL